MLFIEKSESILPNARWHRRADNSKSLPLTNIHQRTNNSNRQNCANRLNIKMCLNLNFIVVFSIRTFRAKKKIRNFKSQVLNAFFPTTEEVAYWLRQKLKNRKQFTGGDSCFYDNVAHWLGFWMNHSLLHSQSSNKSLQCVEGGESVMNFMKASNSSLAFFTTHLWSTHHE